ncbi:MAG: hypothetical protein JWQ87_163 [Candidatus Sulfotelmatobacter sp.]|nr:hypothetical protein [Candidatus Sulfotelmatobacter sp.]
MDRIVWASGPSPDWRGEEHTMPVRQTGPRKEPVVWIDITEEELLQWNKDCGYADILVVFLNAKIRDRLAAANDTK